MNLSLCYGMGPEFPVCLTFHFFFSLYLFKLGLAPQIQDLYGKVDFTGEISLSFLLLCPPVGEREYRIFRKGSFWTFSCLCPALCRDALAVGQASRAGGVALQEELPASLCLCLPAPVGCRSQDIIFPFCFRGRNQQHEERIGEVWHSDACLWQDWRDSS